MLVRSSKKSTAPDKIALDIVKAATGGQKPKKEKTTQKKNPAAMVLGRLGGMKGGKARAEKLSKEERIKIARKAAQMRWMKAP